MGDAMVKPAPADVLGTARSGTAWPGMEGAGMARPQAGTWRGNAGGFVAWSEALQMPQHADQAPPGWWIVVAAPLGLAAWSALGWLLFAAG